MQSPAAKHWMEPWSLIEKLGGLRAPNGIETPQEEYHSQLTWTLWEGLVSETELETKKHAQAGPRPPYTYIAEMLLSLHVSSKQPDRGAISKAVACLWDMFF